ncbi:hypothetical protein B0T17DRAFT_596036 [Bombardia bombarda]|uniref:TauD/TfdA-like domain-containing protein n=1 Tax=Bombardia bombarda TaxID=252184 RepID=A0AA39XM52_9PEZI|nr:hypothetical protein B0T17DRAFT_596036 [Bombardia bombarda]
MSSCTLPSATAPHLPPILEKPGQDILRPDIEWFPSYKVYKDRVEKLRQLHPNRPTTLPQGWPAQIDAERVWSGSDFKSEDDYVFHFSSEDVAEIELALAFFKSLPGELGPDDVKKDTFPLPSLGSRLEEVSRVIHEGRGFVVLRGLQPDKYSNFDNILLYLGITSYIAETRGLQDFDGRMLLHIQAVVEDIKKHGSMPNSPYVARAQPFHTDLCDVLSLYALDVAAYGGESFLASSAKIYNEIARTRPDIIHVLASDDWIFDEPLPKPRPRLPILPPPPHRLALLPPPPLVPAMTELQAEALDTVYFLAKEHAVEITLRKGDMQIFNNFAMLHARSSFVDDETARRHMLRLWLRNEERMWPTPPALEAVSFECYGDNEYRRNMVWDIEQSPPELRIKHRRASCA